MRRTNPHSPEVPALPLEDASLNQVLAVIDALYGIQDETPEGSALDVWCSHNLTRAKEMARQASGPQVAALIGEVLRLWQAEHPASTPCVQKTQTKLYHLKGALSA